MINRKIVLAAAISGLIAILTMVVVSTGQSVKSQTSTAATTTESTNVNFTQLFKEKIKSQFLDLYASVVYQSPSTVVLEGEKLALGPGGLLDNQYLWQAVDLVKQQGYTIESVTMSGLGTENNPDIYHVILSHK